MPLRHLVLVTALGLALASPSLAQTVYVGVLSGGTEVPPVATPATGSATVVLNAAQTQLSISVQFQNLIGTYTASHIHGPAPAGSNAGVRWGFLPPTAPWVFSNANHDGTLTDFITTDVTAADVTNLNAGNFYVNIHSTSFPGGELRAQLGSQPVPSRKTTWNRVKALYR